MKKRTREQEADHRLKFAASIERIMVCFRYNADLVANYFEGVYEQCSDMLPAQFEAVCLDVARTMEPYKPPVYQEYLQAFQKLFGRSKELGCDLCGKSGFVPAQGPDGRPSAVKPCPRCHPMALGAGPETFQPRMDRQSAAAGERAQ